MSDKIKSSYNTSRNFYDDVITHRKWWSKIYSKVVWGGVNDPKIAKILLSKIPDDFNGEILDVPVGTGIFVHKKYQKMKNAKIICMDYSEDMLNIAKSRLKGKNIKLMQGDVGNLPFEDERFDIVFSMNGFHVFPNKKKAFSEVTRVLKKDGLFLSCFYVKGKLKLADFVAKNILSKKGWFTPPFDTEENLRKRLGSDFTLDFFDNDGAIVYFGAHKKH